ncbi:translocation/assembly module TamB domain-containing protein [Jannaschia seohaensis]|uniref:Translocation and assembly module TamB n=1 Tax=Jannaschia seohaensis TaxID=475081 RepID=A0A2Y9C3X6_9RHOB|nr:translocation/assembly module TamB domain-containing protein [Jannaschia seohaensis]PWJ22315.1 translocation and assembly module TamB [Jannaschia seohaensis]SSA38593.1 translocation and assembly module TamB [Jannaschia seohaensis]
MRKYLIPLALLAAPAFAQDAEEERDRGFIVGLIEDNLSAPGLSVRLDGFEGALSSEATLEALTISDDEGPWLRLESVVLDWKRSALLRGRLEVEALTAELIQVNRAPLPAEGVEALPEPGASRFSLPDLPVSVQIQSIRADRIELGAPLLGQDLAMTLQASAQLVEGSGAISLEGRRLDGVEGVIALDASFEAEAELLAVDLDVNEARGGIAASLLQLPGAPAIELTVQGAGPLDDFSADIAVASDGVDRLAGAVTLSGTAEGRAFDVDIGGDVTALFAPRYRPFFGDDVSLRAAGLLRESGGTDLNELSLRTRALTLDGTAAFGADGWPSLLDMEGRLASQDGSPVLLPSATPLSVAGARFVLQYDQTVSEDWALDLTVDGIDQPEVALTAAQIAARGRISRAEGVVTAATGRLSVEAAGLAFVDAALQQAVGDRIAVSAELDWRQDAPLRIADLTFTGPALEAGGAIAVDLAAELPFDLDLTARVPDMTRVAELAGLEALAGAAELSVDGAVSVGGAFDLAIAGAAEGLRTGIAQADGLLEGRTQISAEARRDATGLFLETLDLANAQVTVTGDLAIYDPNAAREAGTLLLSEVDLEVVLADGAVIDPRLAGETRAILALGQGDTGAWQGNATITAPQGVRAEAAGTLTGPLADMTFALTVPEIAPFAPGIPGGVTAEGRAFVDDGGLWNIRADAAGPWAVTARVEGVVTGETPEISYSAHLPDPTAPVPALAALPALAAPVELSGTVRQRGAVWSTDTRIDGPEDVVIRASGPLTGNAPRLDIAVTVPRVEAFAPQVEGTLSLDGSVAQIGGDWQAEMRASGPYDAVATVETVLTDTPLAIDFALTLPDLSQVVAAVPGGLDISGMAVQAPEGWQVDVTGTGPYAAALNVMARLPEAGPEVDATIRIPDASAIAGQLEGPLTVEAQARQRDGVWSADLDAFGPFGATVTARASLPANGAQVTADVRVPNVGAIDPRLSGPLTVDLDARQVAGVWEADLDAAGPLGASVVATARLPEDGAQMVADVRIPDSSVLSPRLSGPLTADLDAAQTGGVWSVDFDADLPFNGTAVGTARLDGQDAEANLRLRLPDSSVIAPQLNGPLDADIVARQVAGTWTVDLDSQGPFGGTISADATLGAESADIEASIRLPDSSRVAPQLAGPVNAQIEATQRDGVWRAAIVSSGPLGGAIDISGVVAGAPVDVEVNLLMPEISRIVPDISGPVSARGQVSQVGADYRLDLDVGGPGGTRADVAGLVSTGGALDLTVAGTAPLGLANPFVAPQRLSGTARFDLAIAGPPALSSVTGTITTEGSNLVLPTLRNSLDGITATIRLTGAQAVIDLRADVETGGDLTISGPVGLAPPFAADLAVRFDGTIADPSLYTARITAEIGVAGPLTGGATITGDILIPEAEIAVPSSGITSVGELPPIDHLGTTRPVQRTLVRAGQDAASRAEATAAAASGPVYGLNVAVRAPGRIFVRGRGLDAELGGDLRITGTTANIVTSGGFELVRGRLDILQQRFNLDEGAITFQGDFVPFIRLVAITEAETLTASIVVEGPADDISVSFLSSPEAPQEEILAQVFFGRDLSELSALQALQLADSVAVLAGRGSGGLLERLRGGAGLDDLDVTTDSEGNTAVRAGKYISDNVYTSVQVDQKGEAEISLNVDLTPSLTLRGTTGATSESSLGVFFERDY